MLPISALSRRLGGASLRCFEQDWYHRVHVIPSDIDVGIVLSTQTRQVEVWNGRFETNVLQAITGGVSGVILSGPGGLPTAFGPLESRTYTLTATDSAPAMFDTRFVLEFTLESHDPRLRVVGRAAIGFPHAPDWSEPVIERLEWLTDVMESHAGYEQRVRLRAHPRRSIEYRLLHGDDSMRATFEHDLISWQARAYAVPIWTDVAALTAAAIAGTTVVQVDTAGRDYAVGGLICLMRGTDIEFGEIDAITATTVTVKLPLIKTWPAGSKVAPARMARMQRDMTLIYPTDAYVVAAPRFVFEGEWAVTPAAETETYRGYPVLTQPPMWDEDLDVVYARKTVELDYATGKRAVDDHSGVTTVIRPHRWLLRGKAEINAFRAWLAARAGRLNPFWLPSFQNDLRPTAPIVSGETAITVANCRYASGPGPVVGRRDIMIVTHTGARYYRRITAAAELSDAEEQIAIDDVLGVTLQPNEVRQIAFMRLVRLEADSIELAHVTDEIAIVSLRTRSIRDDLP